MSQISYEDVKETNANNNSDGVGFFTLKNDGEEAIVRIMCDNIRDLEIFTVHPISINGKFRQVSCIRDPREPLEHCPLCLNGEKVQQQCFIRLIHYYPEYDNMGNVVRVTPKAEVWQRSASVYAPMLKGYIDNYGPLSDIICKITRRGQGLDTKYDISPNLSPAMYPAESYPKMPEMFEGYKVLGRVILDKSFEEIEQFVATGNFPMKNQDANNSTPATPNNTFNGGHAPEPIPNGYVKPYNTAPTTQTQPGFGSEGMERPVRRY